MLKVSGLRTRMRKDVMSHQLSVQGETMLSVSLLIMGANISYLSSSRFIEYCFGKELVFVPAPLYIYVMKILVL